MISGAHAIIYTKNAEADKAFFRDVLKLPNVDVGRGWLIFRLPPSEIAMHPSDEQPYHEVYLMCDDIELFISKMTILKVECTAPNDQGWGILSEITLPGGGKLGIYQPRHARPQAVSSKKATKKTAGRKAKSASKSKTKKATAKTKPAAKSTASKNKASSKLKGKKAAPARSKPSKSKASGRKRK